MTNIDAKDVMKLRTETGAGVNDCKKALGETNGDFEKAKDLLRKWGSKIAEKKASRATSSGVIVTYLHPTPETARVGVMLQLNCETDFVARNPELQVFCRQICQHIAAMNPQFTTREEVPAATIEREKEIYLDQVKDKPPAAQEKIIQGKLEKFFEDRCLVDQVFVLDNTKKIREALTAMIAKIGENMKIGRFARFEIGT
jgi:elongation factor Ts